MSLTPLLNLRCGDVDNSPSFPHLHSDYYDDDGVPALVPALVAGKKGTSLFWIFGDISILG